jgi:hypothetical protein
MDKRRETGIYGMIRMSALDKDIAKAAREAGGDAVILVGEDEKVVGIASMGSASASGTYGWGGWSGSGFGSSFTHAVKNHMARFIVIKYLADSAASPVQPAPPAPAAAPTQAPQPAVALAPAPKPACGSVPQPDGSVKIIPC